eukprot:scaffold62_cov256-Pinguiococcus_pyrenoidosus.AAC.27
MNLLEPAAVRSMPPAAVRTVVFHNLGRIARVDLVDVLTKFASHGFVELLQILKPAVLYKGAPRLHVVGKQLCKLPQHILLHFDGTVPEQRLQGLQVRALCQHGLQAPSALHLQVLAAVLVDHAGKQVPKHVGLRQRSGVIGRVPPDLAQGPGAGRLDVVLGLLDKRLLQRRHALGHDDRERERLAEGRDEAQGHDAGKLGVAGRLAHVIHERGGSARVHNQLGELRGVLGDLPYRRGGVLAHELVIVLEAIQDVGEDLGFDHHLREVDGVLGNLRQAAAHLALELGVGMRDEWRQVRHGARIHHGLRELRRVLADVGHGGGRDALEGHLRLLQAQN